MELTEVADHLIKFGAILGIVLGLVSFLFWIYIILLGLGPPFFAVNFYDLFMVSTSLLSIVIGYYVLTRFPHRISEDPARSAIYLILLGIVVAFGAWGIAGLLIAIGAVLILIEETT
ncbi:MAG: hypothetical protein ACFFCH_09620 [Promethearchaeota archaeon]